MAIVTERTANANRYQRAQQIVKAPVTTTVWNWRQLIITIAIDYATIIKLITTTTGIYY